MLSFKHQNLSDYKMSKGRDSVIDSFRGVAVLLVTSFHIFLWSSSSGQPFFNDWDFYGPFGNGWVGVGIFFVISGYCMGISTKNTFSQHISIGNYSIYFLKRFLRISLPYYVSIVFWFFLINFFGVAIKPTGPVDVITHLLFVHNMNERTMFSISGVYWSLAVEMQFYVVLPVLVVLFKSIKMKTLLLITSLTITVVVNVCSDDRVLTWSLIPYLYLFVFGWVLQGLSLGRIPINIVIACRNLLFFVFVFSLFYKGEGFNNNIKIYETWVSTASAVLMWLCINTHNRESSDRERWLAPLSFVGRCSFSIYLYNYIFWIVPRNDASTTLAIATFLFVIMFGVAMFYFVEKPSERIRMDLFKRFKQQPVT